jgi:hypothetical protein
MDSRSTAQTASRARFLDGDRVRVLGLTTLVDNSDGSAHQHRSFQQQTGSEQGTYTEVPAGRATV